MARSRRDLCNLSEISSISTRSRRSRRDLANLGEISVKILHGTGQVRFYGERFTSGKEGICSESVRNVGTAAYDAVHGAPIHIGDPSMIGIEDIYAPDFGDLSDVGDLIPVFWACGVTSLLAVRSASKSVLPNYKQCPLSQCLRSSRDFN